MSGIFGIVSKRNCAETLFYGTDYHSHLGTEYGGMAVLGEGFTRQIHGLSQSQFKSKFFPDLGRMEGNRGIGVVSALDEQPIYLNSRFGPFCLATSGLVENAEELAAAMLKKGLSFSEVSPRGVNTTELIAKLITQGTDLVDGIEKAFEAIEGSCSLLLLHRAGIYAARDRFGYISPIAGRGPQGWAVTTETCAFANLGFDTVKYLQPGEIVLVNEDGIVQRRPGRGRIQQIRSLEGHDVTDVSPYIDHTSEKHRQMVDWIAKDLGVTTLRYQTVDDMASAIGLPRQKLCLYCWTGQCPQAAVGIVATTKSSGKRKALEDSIDQQQLW